MALLLASAALCAGSRLCAAETPPGEAAARAAIGDMVKAYRGLRSLQQDTTYKVTGPGQVAPERSRLLMQRPNKILVEVYTKLFPHPQPVVTRYLCDGKSLYVYSEDRGWYRRLKAPRNMDGLQELSFCIEMACLTGQDPLGALRQTVANLRLGETALVDGVDTITVQGDVADPGQTGTVTLYIGKTDHLLRRLSVLSRPIPRPTPKPADGATTPAKPAPTSPGTGPIGDDDTLEDVPLPAVDQTLTIEAENHVQVNPSLPKDTFEWLTPAGALYYDPDGRGTGPTVTQKLPGQNGKTKVTKPVPLSEVIKRAQRRR